MGAIRRWFGTPAAVVWICILTTIVVLVEAVFPRLDEHGFWFLYGITYLSWITQPVLAYVGSVGAEHSDATQQQILTVVEGQQATLTKVEDLEEQVAALVGQLAAKEDQELALLRATQGGPSQ
jgi:hypothetical protein